MAALGFSEWARSHQLLSGGTMLSDAAICTKRMVVVTFPGLAILLTVLAFNLMGDGLRDAFDQNSSSDEVTKWHC